MRCFVVLESLMYSLSCLDAVGENSLSLILVLIPPSLALDLELDRNSFRRHNRLTDK